MLSRSLSILLFGVVSVTLPSVSLAEIEPSTNAVPQDIERITKTVSRYSVVANQYPGSLSWVDEKTLASVSPQHIEQALNRIAGVNLQRGNGQEYLPALRSPVFTGAGACGELLTAEDGIALRAAGFCNINEMFEAGTEYAQRVEVLKGPGTVIYGSNAMHGVVNIITRDSISANDQIGLEMGSYGFNRARLSVGNNQTEHGLGLNLAVTDDSGYRDEEGFEQTKAQLRYAHQLRNMNITAGLSISDLDQETAGFITGLNSYRDPEIAQSNANPEAYRNAESSRLWVKLEGGADVGNQPFDWQITPYIRWQEMAFLMHFLPGQPTEENEQDSIGVLSSVSWQASPTVQWTLGLDAEQTSAALRQFQPNATQGSAFLQATIPQGLQYDYQVDADMLAVFTELSWQLTEDIQLLAGVRAEQIEYEYDNLMLAGRTDELGNACGFGGCRYSRPADRDDDFSNTAPQLALNYQLDESQSFFVRIAHGYRAPQATELYRLQRQQQVAELDSVEANSVEAGYRWFSAPASLSVAIYSMQKDNVIFRDIDFFNRSNAKTRHQGIELTLQLALAKNWTLKSAMTYAKHEYRNNLGDLALAGNDMDTAPRWLANAQLQWAAQPNLDLSLEWRHVSDYYLEPENQQEYSGHNVFDLRSQWQVNQDWLLRFHVLNVFDRAYAERADWTTFSGPRYFPGRPRSVQMGVEYQF